MSQQKTKVLILGGGFAGVYTAIYLEKLLGRQGLKQVDISLVNRENYIVFQPLLPEVISGTIDILNAISPIRRLARRTTLFTREIEAVDFESRTVRLSPGTRPRPHVVEFDHLVLALGTQLDYSKVPGMREHAVPFRYLGDALFLRNHLVHVMEEASIETDPQVRQRLLTFIVAGGGFSGVECISEMQDFLRGAVRVYPSIGLDDLKFMLVQSADRILPEIEERLAQFGQRILRRRKIEILLKSRLVAVSAAGAIIQDRETRERTAISAGTVVATVPAGPHGLIAELPLELSGGRIKVDENLSVVGVDNVWALGDCAATPQPDGLFSPPTAQHALRQAGTCAHNIHARLHEKQLKSFSFTGLGKLGSLGRRSAVAEIMGVRITGFLAWLIWRSIYLAKFPGIDRKFRIMLDWFQDLFVPRDVTGVRIFPHNEVAAEHYEAGDFVIHQGDYGDKVFFVVRGELEVSQNGNRLTSLGPGDTFGEVALISGQPRNASIRALSPSDVVAVRRDAFHQILAHVPGVQPAMEQIMKDHLPSD